MVVSTLADPFECAPGPASVNLGEMVVIPVTEPLLSRPIRDLNAVPTGEGCPAEDGTPT